MKIRLLFAVLVGGMLLPAELIRADAITYIIPTGTVGNQSFGGELGLDFSLNSPITLTHLGVFDSASNGLSNNITARLWDRTNTAAPLATIAFAAGSPGHLVGGSRYLPLASPITLPAGFQGTISASGYGALEPNGNKGVAAFTSSTNSDGGAILFVGGGRNGAAGAFPGGLDGGPANRYAAGTFVTHDLSQTGIAYRVPAGTVGNQVFGGSLGMDFDVNNQFGIDITQLGVFDSGQDGLQSTITAHIYDRNNPAAPLASLSFTPGDPGTLLDGSRFKDLIDPLHLQFGFEGSIVAEGYSSLEPNGNAGGALPIWILDQDPAVEFLGTGRFGTAGLFPATPDGGGANRYAAGTFSFLVSTPEPTTIAMWLLLGLFALGVNRLHRRQKA